MVVYPMANLCGRDHGHALYAVLATKLRSRSMRLNGLEFRGGGA